MTYELAVKLKEAGFPQIWPHSDMLEIHDAVKIQEIKDKDLSPRYRIFPNVFSLKLQQQ